MKSILLICLFALTGCVCNSNTQKPDNSNIATQWRPIGNRKARVVHWGIVHKVSLEACNLKTEVIE